jgi:hypothetical protein
VDAASSTIAPLVGTAVLHFAHRIVFITFNKPGLIFRRAWQPGQMRRTEASFMAVDHEAMA